MENPNFSVEALETTLRLHMVAVNYILNQLLVRHGINYEVEVREITTNSETATLPMLEPENRTDYWRTP